MDLLIRCSRADEYGEFVTTFTTDGTETKIKISCDGDYALWVNGIFVASNQYRDYEHYKIYDTVDISPYVKKGENRYFNPMLRLACRYLEIQSENPVQVEELGIIPQYYPAKIRPQVLTTPLDQKIYDMCVNTLNLCMMENYVDCPWGEQNFYAFDSRNQMCCGYRVYEDGNLAYARANLKLMAQDRRDDGILSICAPCGIDLTIPSTFLKKA